MEGQFIKEFGIDDVIDNIRMGKYDEPKRPDNTREKAEGYIFDENKTIKENKEMVKVYNEQAKLNLMQYRNDCVQKYQDFRNDLITAIENEYNFNPVQAELIYNEAYVHGDYYEEKAYEARKFADFAEKFLDVTPGVRD